MKFFSIFLPFSLIWLSLLFICAFASLKLRVSWCTRILLTASHFLPYSSFVPIFLIVCLSFLSNYLWFIILLSSLINITSWFTISAYLMEQYFCILFFLVVFRLIWRIDCLRLIKFARSKIIAKYILLLIIN